MKQQVSLILPSLQLHLERKYSLRLLRKVRKWQSLEESAEAICCTKSISLSSSAVPLMYLKVKINDEIISQALIDSGAQRSLIHESLLLQGGWCSRIDVTRRSTVHAIGEEKGLLSCGLINLDITTDSFALQSMSFVVVPDEINMVNKVIFGMDFIQTNKLIIDVAHRVISAPRADGSTCDWILEKDGSLRKALLRKVACVAATDVKLEADTSEMIPLMFSGEELPLKGVDPSRRTELFFYDEDSARGNIRNLNLYSGIMNSQDMKVMVKNVHKDRKEIKKGAFIGFVSSVEELEEDGQQETDWTAEKIKQLIELDDQLRDEQKETIWKMIYDSSAALSSGSDDVGRAAVTAHVIRLHDEIPIYQRPRRFPEPINREIEEQCHELYNRDIIEPSISPWSSPVVPVRKKDGTIRLCIDYRKLNHVTKADRSPIPSLNESVYNLHGAKYFTSLDCVQGFHQIPLSEESKEYTAFSTSKSHWQFKRLGFGLRNAPAAFQGEIQNVLQEVSSKKVIVYIDDIMIIEDTFEKHLELVINLDVTTDSFALQSMPCLQLKDVASKLNLISVNGLLQQLTFSGIRSPRMA